MINSKLKVSVCMVTYKHERYIGKAVESILNQQTENFEIELMIGDDCSPDHTYKIIKELINSHSKGACIRYIRRVKNVGMRNNFIDLLQHCKGKYIALCDGDDYWTDPLKLQKQVDFLEKNNNYAGSSHNAIVLNSFTNTEKFFDKSMKNKDIFFQDCMEKRKFHTASFVFRSELISTLNLPENIVSLDRALFLYIAYKGPIMYFGESMCCYRKNEGGISSRVTADQMALDLNIPKWVRKSFYKGDLSKLTAYINKSILTYSSKISLIRLIKHYHLYVLYSLLDSPRNFKSILFFTKSRGLDLLKKSYSR